MSAADRKPGVLPVKFRHGIFYETSYRGFSDKFMIVEFLGRTSAVVALPIRVFFVRGSDHRIRDAAHGSPLSGVRIVADAFAGLDVADHQDVPHLVGTFHDADKARCSGQRFDLHSGNIDVSGEQAVFDDRCDRGNVSDKAAHKAPAVLACRIGIRDRSVKPAVAHRNRTVIGLPEDAALKRVACHDDGVAVEVGESTVAASRKTASPLIGGRDITVLQFQVFDGSVLNGAEQPVIPGFRIDVESADRMHIAVERSLKRHYVDADRLPDVFRRRLIPVAGKSRV